MKRFIFVTKAEVGDYYGATSIIIDASNEQNAKIFLARIVDDKLEWEIEKVEED